MNKDIKQNLEDLKEAIEKEDRVQEYILRDLLEHDCKVPYKEIQEYINNK